MDANTGTLLFEMNKDERLPPASVTKIMTLLLVFEALENNVIKLDDILQVSENAASMGGSQIFLEPGEKMSVEDLIKSVVIASANDAAVTLAEHIGGSEEAFVYSMNKRAKELGMNNTYFENATGLDDDTTMHLTTAYDIALMSRELLKHEKIMEYTTIWMDTVRNGAFGLSNTNKLIRFYKGATGLKTGSTSKAGFCISATAKRKNLHLISVIMGSETSQVRNASATKLLDLGFAKYEIFFKDDINIDPIKVCGGKKDYINAVFDSKEIIIPKSKSNNVEIAISTKEVLNAPVKKGEVVGSIIYKLDGEIIDEAEIYSSESVDEIDFIWYLGSILKKIIIN
jgi:D-alanyl-D-alanine carboxypeptidase (penicillin-binding protein 5/6)